MVTVKKKNLIWTRVPQSRIDYHCLWCQISTTSSNTPEIAQLANPSRSLPQPATDNCVRDGRQN